MRIFPNPLTRPEIKFEELTMTPDLNRAQRSTLHSAMLTALNLPATDAQNGADARLQAWCETICWVEYPEDVLNLAHAISIPLLDYDYVEVDADSLREIEGEMEVNLALRLNGVCARPSGRGVLWTNCPTGSRGEKIKLSENLTND